MIVRIWKLSLALFVLIVVLQIPLFSTYASAVSFSGKTSLTNLDDDASQWGIFQDHGSVLGTVENVAQTSPSGPILVASLLGGQPYTGMHVYRNVAPIDNATTFELSLSFEFTSLANVQALEFTTSKWVQNKRWEWALQWENIGDGSIQQGDPASWRLWTGSNWQNIGIQQLLRAHTWHTLHLYGDIFDGNVRYLGFTSDALQTNLTNMFEPVSSAGDKVAVAVQLDGNNNEDSYQVSLDKVRLSWKSTTTLPSNSYPMRKWSIA